jgi:hypothetical protein
MNFGTFAGFAEFVAVVAKSTWLAVVDCILSLLRVFVGIFNVRNLLAAWAEKC